MGSNWPKDDPNSNEWLFSKKFLVLLAILALLAFVGYALTEEEEEPNSWIGGEPSVSTQVTPRAIRIT